MRPSAPSFLEETTTRDADTSAMGVMHDPRSRSNAFSSRVFSRSNDLGMATVDTTWPGHMVIIAAVNAAQPRTFSMQAWSMV